MIKEEKDRRRNICFSERMKDDLNEKDDPEKVVLDGAVQEAWSTGDDNDTLDFNCITLVSKIPISNGITRESTAQQFTLNKNQRAAFMIITGHLDDMDKSNSGNAVKLIISLLIR